MGGQKYQWMGGGWCGWVELSVDGRWVVWMGRIISGWEADGVGG